MLSLLTLLSCDRADDTLVEASLVGAKGVTITQVVLHQGPERVLAVDGDSEEGELPLVAGRDALVRVFYTSDEDVGELVTGRLELANGARFDVDMERVAASEEMDLDSTLNFTIPGDEIDEAFEYRVSILEEGRQDNESAYFPAEGFDLHETTGQPTVFKLVLVPFEYNADGSGRTPDTSDEAIAAYVDRFRQVYPIADVEITVHDPVPWSSAIKGNGQGWQEVGFELYSLRASEGASEDSYYYGMFKPTDSLAQFCSGGCLLGVTLLNNTPSDVGEPSLRLGLGVGFEDVAADTMLHELGHAHGREHAPCGQGLDPSSIDSDFPNNDGAVDGLMWDPVGGELVTGMTDLMGYCSLQWSSAYTYTALHTRMVNIQNSGNARSAGLDEDVLFVDGKGNARWGGVSGGGLQVGGERLAVQLDGERSEGRFYRFSHLPGGWLVVPTGAQDVRFELDGRVHIGTR